MSGKGKNVYNCVDFSGLDRPNYIRWYVDGDSLDIDSVNWREYERMDVNEGDVVIISGRTFLEVVKDTKEDCCCKECTLGLPHKNSSKALSPSQLAALCMMCNCGDGFFDKTGKSVHLEEMFLGNEME